MHGRGSVGRWTGPTGRVLLDVDEAVWDGSVSVHGSSRIVSISPS